ncbi:MAG: hypothetical protein KGJ77_07015 [Acidobacteriota bacterium]|nr:hypothetical protein [Acidobacteriota bacterium]
MSVAFDAVFGFFALSMVVIAVLAVRWAVRRDRAARRAARSDAAGAAGPRPRPGLPAQ